MLYQLTEKSKNSKTGPIPVTMTERESCPPSCPLYDGGCYAMHGPLSWSWKKHMRLTIGELCDRIRKFPPLQLWRHNQAGDLPGKGEDIDIDDLEQIVEANAEGDKKGFTFCHKLPYGENAKAIKYANDNGFTVNLSANNLDQAEEYLSLGIAPVVVVVPEDSPKHFRRNGVKYVNCPAQWRDTNCKNCGLCQKQRDYVITFKVHGAGRKKAEKVSIGGK